MRAPRLCIGSTNHLLKLPHSHLKKRSRHLHWPSFGYNSSLAPQLSTMTTRIWQSNVIAKKESCNELELDSVRIRSHHGQEVTDYQCRSATRQPYIDMCSWHAYMLWVSRRIVNEKQHLSSLSLEEGSGFFSEQLVNIAFCELSKAMAPNLSQ